MYKLRRLSAPIYACAALAIALSLSGCGKSEKTQALTSTATVIVSGYQTLAAAVKSLDRQSLQFCSSPNQVGLEQTRAAWSAAMDAWMRIQPINFGPIRTLDLAYKIQFWPDPRDMVGLELKNQLEQTQSDTAAMKSQIAQASVAVHGLPAIEVLLYPDEGEALQLFLQPQRCQVLTAVVTNLDESTTELARAWAAPDNGFARQFSEFGGDKAYYSDADAAVSALLGSMVQTLDAINGSKLGWPLGERADGVPQPFQVESRRSLRSLDNIQANLEGLQALYSAGEGYGLEDYLRSLNGGAELADKVNAQFRVAITEAGKLAPLFPALKQGSELQDYKDLLASTRLLTELLGEKVAAILGVSGGLNFNDGD